MILTPVVHDWEFKNGLPQFTEGNPLQQELTDAIESIDSVDVN